jgi:predicted transcriptional regulator
MNILKDFVGESIPVVNDKNKLIGVISENDVLKAYDQITQTIRNIEKN